jgi:predicted nucleic acid-binding protein
MLSIDTNILFHAFNEDSPSHAAAFAWLTSRKDFAFRRLYDVRSALTMTAQGVTEFATANVKDYEGMGFRRVWNPLVAS